MLNMRVYSERVAEMNSISTRNGEDALPFINQNGMFVADGMGGSAGVRVVDLKKECFSPDTLAALLKRDGKLCKDPVIFAQYAAYIKDSFAALTDEAMRRIYENPNANIVRLKKSGYIGSHALGCVLAEILLSLSDVPESLWETRIRALPNEILEGYKDIISRLGAVCAKTTMSKICYYGTTLSAVFYREREDHIDAFFLNAGDSRMYVWDADGFRQAAEDQGRNGGMTDVISLNDLKNVKFSLERRTYRKPCVLFGMTDGAYGLFGGKNGFASSPMRMESYLLHMLSLAESADEFTRKLKELYDVRGGYDDSNSMAIAAFGFDSYQDLREAAKARMETLEKTYDLGSLPPEFFTEDYKALFETRYQKVESELEDFLMQAYRLDSIHDHCCRQMSMPLYSERYIGVHAEYSRKTDDLRKRQQGIEQELCGLIQENYLDFMDSETAEACGFLKRAWNTLIPDASAKARDAKLSYYTAAESRLHYIDNAKRRQDQITVQFFDFCGHLQVPDEILWDALLHAQLGNACSSMTKTLKSHALFIQQELNTVQRYSEEMLKHLDKWRWFNHRIYEDAMIKNRDCNASFIMRQWCSEGGMKRAEKIAASFVFVREQILARVKSWHDCEAELQKLELDAIRAKEAAAETYWKEHALDDIRTLLHDGVSFAKAPELRTSILEKLELDEELNRYRTLYEKQKRIFTQYLTEHLREVSEEKRLDVEKNGWL